MSDGVGISEIANRDNNRRHSGRTWLCPYCDVRCEYGKFGCDDPRNCSDGEKNLHWYDKFAKS